MGENIPMIVEDHPNENRENIQMNFKLQEFFIEESKKIRNFANEKKS
ncbi:MAG: hypothetical protein LBH58_00355 [Tannerellaceae bacterium]|jgi:hypothetical protein|nr:hypothetical protein [Tannerellaceae bacterium]